MHNSSNDTEAFGHARAYWSIGPGIGELRSEPLSQPSSGHILLRTIHSGISRGTETRIGLGDVPASEWPRMRCPMQTGDFPFPVKYGYCNVAEVIAGPDHMHGQSVFALYPHQDIYWLPADMATPLPAGLPPARAVLTANMETALNAVWDAGAAPGDRVIVIGAGTLGLLVAYLIARIPGTEVRVIDINPDRNQHIEWVGASPAQADELADDADIVINASGSQAGLATALGLLGDEGLVLEVGWLGAPAMLPLDGAFHSKRLTIKSSQVGQLPMTRRPRWDHRRRLTKALELLAGEPALDRIISHQISFDDLPETMAKLCAGWQAPLTIRVDYRP